MSDDSDDEFFKDPVDNLQEETLVQASGGGINQDDADNQGIRLTVYDVDGVERIILEEQAQVAITAAVGPDVTGEQPWKKVNKELIMEHIEANGKKSPFAAFKKELEVLDNEEVLMGYILDEARDYDEYYICLTNEAKNHCEYQAEKFIRKQIRKLEKSVLKKSNPWTSLGSEMEVDENIPKNNRPLIRIEIKSRYPFANQPECFQVRTTDDVRDGFAELISTRIKFTNIFKKRVDAAVQANPQRIEAEAQTIPRFPHNIWTQASVEGGEYKQETEIEKEEFEIPAPKGKSVVSHAKMSRKDVLKAKMNNLADVAGPPIMEIVHFNDTVDIYNINYPDLINKADNTASTVYDMTFQDYICFTDFKAKDKHVSMAMFHPMWTGILAVSYSDIALCLLKKQGPPVDEVNRAVFGDNPVMIWSLSDSLRPKLYLESNREVTVLSFCPHDENLLVGCCNNGQIILWDLKDKLNALEFMEILTPAQDKYRTAINAQMGWLKRVHSRSVVRAATMSDLQFDHKSSVRDISWISPNYKIDQNGKAQKIQSNKEKCVQFITAAEDGTLLFWDVSLPKAKRTIIKTPTANKKGILSRSDLMVEKSPYKIFDGVLKPFFRIIVGSPMTSLMTPLTAITFHKPKIRYENLNITEEDGRQLFAPIIEEEPSYLDCQLWVASMYGETLHIEWKGSNVTGEGQINKEYSNILLRSKIHNGSIACTKKNPFVSEIVATVGGKIFAIWHDRLPNKPLIWKVLQYVITGAIWSKFIPSQFFLTTEDGCVEVWDFLRRSDAPIKSQNVAGKMITGITMHSLPLEQDIIALADLDASMRLLTIPKVLTQTNSGDEERTRAFFERELKIKLYYEDWQDKWLEKNKDFVTKNKTVEKEAEKKTREPQVDSGGDASRKKKAQPSERKDTAVLTMAEKREQRWRNMQWAAIKKTMESMKQLNVAELKKQEKPLKDLEIQKSLRLKQKIEILNCRDQIFAETVAILFPEALEIPEEESEPIAEEIKIEKYKTYLSEYASISQDAEKFIESNPYEYTFDWKDTIIDGKQRRLGLDYRTKAYFAQRNSILTEDDSFEEIDESIETSIEDDDDLNEKELGEIEENEDEIIPNVEETEDETVPNVESEANISQA